MKGFYFLFIFAILKGLNFIHFIIASIINRFDLEHHFMLFESKSDPILLQLFV